MFAQGVETPTKVHQSHLVLRQVLSMPRLGYSFDYEAPSGHYYSVEYCSPVECPRNVPIGSQKVREVCDWPRSYLQMRVVADHFERKTLGENTCWKVVYSRSKAEVEGLVAHHVVLIQATSAVPPGKRCPDSAHVDMM